MGYICEIINRIERGGVGMGLKKKIKIIDCHQHVQFHGYNAEKLIKHLDDLGVSKAWLLTWESIDGSLEPGYTHFSIEGVWDAYQKYPDRFIPFYAPDPRREDVENRLKEWYEKGIKGFGEHKVRIKIDNPDSVEIYHLCGDMKLPVLFHMDIKVKGKKYGWYNADIDDLERVLKECKKTVFIAHGPGWWRYISKDEYKYRNEIYPRGKIKGEGKLIRLLDKYPNLYAEISAESGYNAITRDKDFGLRFLERFHKKILYGTDYHDRRHLDYLLNSGLSQKILSYILYKNAERVIKTR